jgi:flavodoxin
MKSLKYFAALSTAVLTAVSCGPKKADAPKVLVLYYSQTATTKTVAKEIANRLDADIEEIVPVKPYDGTYEETIARGVEERSQGIHPEIQPLKSDLSAYDVVFLGYPIWFGTFAPPVGTFLEQADLSGKKVVPFCTFGSGGLVSSVRDLKEKQPDAEVLPGYGVRQARIDAVPGEIDRFLKANGFLEGEYTPLEEFPKAHEATEEEAAVFDAAVGDYPMIHAKAKAVSSRSIPGGVEYLFTAVDIPREDAPGMMPERELKVYVTVEEGKEPVFTQVVR